MYNIPYFKDTNEQRVIEFMEQHPFITLIGSFANGQPIATQVPVLIIKKEDGFYLQGHIMRNTDHHKAFIENTKALAIFTGASAYVSATWYSHTQMGSTYNYMSVHVAGELRFLQQEEFVQFMRNFTLHFEKGNENSATIYDNLPADYIDKLMPAIIGFEIKADKIEHVFKLSQNRDEASYESIIEKLSNQGGQSAVIANEMIKRKQELYRLYK
jgi:transcriptional regulator